MAPTSNEAERQRWNDEYWAGIWPRREVMTDGAGASLLEALSLRPGERVLDVGSGTGATTMRAAEHVAPRGEVVGADISASLVAYATARALERGAANVTYLVRDAQTDEIPGAPFDVVMSQFGVMFFDEPDVAFANLRAHARPGGRLGFACWRGIEENPWFPAHALAGLVPAPAAPAPGKQATGPFALAEPERTAAILRGAGWAQVARRGVDARVVIERDALLDPGQPAHMGVAPELLDEAARRVEEYYARFEVGGGRIEIPLAFQVFSAVNP